MRKSSSYMVNVEHDTHTRHFLSCFAFVFSILPSGTSAGTNFTKLMLSSFVNSTHFLLCKLKQILIAPSEDIPGTHHLGKHTFSTGNPAPGTSVRHLSCVNIFKFCLQIIQVALADQNPQPSQEHSLAVNLIFRATSPQGGDWNKYRKGGIGKHLKIFSPLAQTGPLII